MTSRAPGADDRAHHAAASRFPAYRWLAVLPAIGLLGGVPLGANRVRPYVLGLPFLLFWIVSWVVATSALLAVVYAMDRARERRRGEARWA